MHLEISSERWRPFCPWGDELTHCGSVDHGLHCRSTAGWYHRHDAKVIVRIGRTMARFSIQNFHSKCKTVSRLSYRYNEKPYARKNGLSTETMPMFCFVLPYICGHGVMFYVAMALCLPVGCTWCVSQMEMVLRVFHQCMYICLSLWSRNNMNSEYSVKQEISSFHRFSWK